MGIQKQLDTPYHSYLRDRLLNFVDVSPIQEALRDRIPRTSQQLINSVPNRLSDKPKTSGTVTVNIWYDQGGP